jgi:Ca2+-binding EF-hand superfamily protein
LSIEEKNELVNFFREFDKDNDGVISTHELKTALEQRKKISA